MINDLEDFNRLASNDEYKHIFFLTSPILVFISKLVIEEFSISKRNIILIPFRNTNINLVRSKLIIQKGSFFDKVIKKFFLFSFQGYKLRKKVESNSKKFILYCDWDSREVLELLNSKKCMGHAYIEEGQLSFNRFKAYKFTNNRYAQWKRLKRWSHNIKNMTSESDIPNFDECFNEKAFAFFTIYKNAFPLMNNEKKYNFKDFSSIKNNYKPQIMGKKNIGIMCSPRRLKLNQWQSSIKKIINVLPKKSTIKLHPEFYSNKIYLEKFRKIFSEYNSKEISICDSSIILEAEMLFEEKILYGPLSSLKTYAPLLGSKFIDIPLY